MLFTPRKYTDRSNFALCLGWQLCMSRRVVIHLFQGTDVMATNKATIRGGLVCPVKDDITYLIWKLREAC
jgi:hypothetical protein